MVSIDGDICSQLLQYIIGHLYIQKGFAVNFDLRFLEYHGKDLNNEFTRNFDLFPHLKFYKVNKYISSYYIDNFYSEGNNTSN